MSKHKQKNIDKIYKNNFVGKAHKKMDAFILVIFPKYRSIAGRLPAIDKAYKLDRKKKAARYGQKIPCPLCEDVENRYIKACTKTMNIMANDYP